MKGFKFLVLGTVLAKIFGLLREFLLLSEFGYSQEISTYFSLIAILGIFTFFSDTSIINAIAYPLWIEAKQVIIKINLKIILIITCLVIFLFFYNYFIFDSINNNHLKFLISISIIPLILNSILYSILIFLEKKKEDREDGSNRNGYYKITSFGLMFCENKMKARQSVLIFNNKFEGYSGNEISIQDALTQRFSYNELMGYNQ